jgi:hypothetical protein
MLQLQSIYPPIRPLRNPSQPRVRHDWGGRKEYIEFDMSEMKSQQLKPKKNGYTKGETS